MIRPPPIPTRTDQPFPYSTPFRSSEASAGTGRFAWRRASQSGGAGQRRPAHDREIPEPDRRLAGAALGGGGHGPGASGGHQRPAGALADGPQTPDIRDGPVRPRRDGTANPLYLGAYGPRRRRWRYEIGRA